MAATLDDLQLLNPWWTSEGAWSLVPSGFHRPQLEDLVRALEDPQSEPGVLLVGFRRIGKTVLAKQVLRHFHEVRDVPSTNILYVDFQEAILGDATPVQVVGIALERRAAGPPAIVVLDELQFVDDWDRQLRTIIQNHGPDELLVLATGSGAKDLRRATGDVLLDRVRFVRLGPMTFAEWLSMGGRDLESPMPLLTADLLRFHSRGGFPGLVAERSDGEARARLRRLCEGRVIDGDLAPRYGIRNRLTFSQLWLHLAHNPGVTLDWSRLPGQFGVARETFEGWVHVLLQSEMICELEPGQRSGLPLHGRKRYSRVYPVDHALSHAYGVPVHEGPGLEALVLRQLREFAHARRAAGLVTHLTYWRDDRLSGPNEIDFRIEGDQVSLLIEVKGSSAPTGSMIARLAEVAARLDRSHALLLHGGVEQRTVTRPVNGLTVRVRIMPVLVFLLAMHSCGLNAQELMDDD